MNDAVRLVELKRLALDRRRAVICDNDASDVAGLLTGSTNADLIDCRTRPAVEAGAVTYIYNTGKGLGVGHHANLVGSPAPSKRGT